MAIEGIPVAGHIALAVYRALIDGLPSKALDFQVRWFADDDAQKVRDALSSEPPQEYLNGDGGKVRWELAALVIEPFDTNNPGDEVAGMIMSVDDLAALAAETPSPE